ncbi:MAG: SDR family NAD(P)-dependent oxidoreductase [Pseudomonadota bacterium]
MDDFKDKVAVITGGATGIGFGLAKRFGALGAKIVIGEPRQNRLDEALASLTELGIEAAAMVLDVGKPESMEAFADFVWETHGGAHVLINNAGIAIGRAPLPDVDLDDMRRLFDVNLFGVWHGAASFGKRMIAQGEPAAIYNVASENAFFNAVQNSAAYITSKHAVRGLTEAMRDDFPDFIQVGMIVPGFVASEMTKGSEQLAMDADTFAEKVVTQIAAGEFYVVTHAYNIERIKPIHDEIEGAYARNAPRYDGDDEYDVPTLIARLSAGRDGS